jgi:nucleoid-associated protein YgaU
MGIFDFVRSAGEKLSGSEKKAEEAREEAFQERRKGNELMQHVIALGFEIDGFRVDYDDGQATIKGTVPDQSTRERVVLAVGNVAGVARVDDRMEVSAPAPEAVMYTVVSGDSLSKIAKAHYGDASKYPVIFEANQPLLKDPNKIYPGQVLRIPPLDG